MAKEKTMYVCSSCGQDSSKWVGKCLNCGAWNTYEKMQVYDTKKASSKQSILGINQEHKSPIPLHLVSATEEVRLDMLDKEFNRVLGGGLVAGSLTLLGGEPGIGKSTLLLQTIMRLGQTNILYVSGEESERQIKLRADRLEKEGEVLNKEITILCETNIERIFTAVKNINPKLIVIDSIQTLSSELVESTAGSVSQIRECAALILKYAKESQVPVILVGHITKEGSLAGPKVLEHVVDTVLQFEGDRQHLYRILRSSKNRFGNTSEIGIYEMCSYGLRQVENPSEFLLSNAEGLSGIAIASAIEGVRPLLIETQALVSSAVYGTPQRSSTGFDMRRLNMLLAVLEKRVGFKLAQKDVFLNIAGGIKVTDPAIDLSVLAAIISSSMDVGLEQNICMAGEVGLSGEIRPITRVTQRIAEAEKLGFSSIVIPEYNVKGLDLKTNKIKVIPVLKVEEALRNLFG